MEKVRNKIYKLSDLEPGDRFYFAGDRKKIIYTLNHEKPFEVIKQKMFWIRYGNCRNSTAQPGQLQVERHKAERQVVFLRNENN